MLPRIKSHFSQAVVDEALPRYGLAKSDLGTQGGFESFVYPCMHDDKRRILRISHSLHRAADQIASEIDWIHYLAANEVMACAAVPSIDGKLVEVLNDGSEYFTATLFERAPGGPARADEWQPPLFEKMGRMMGRMHAVTKDYLPRDQRSKRPEWHEEVRGNAEKYLPSSQRAIIDKFNLVLDECHALPKDSESYGLIHVDFHRGNFFVDDGEIYLFDFDDCQYSWFADDIAIALFYAVPHDCTSTQDLDAARNFMEHFLAGYRTQNSLSDDWINCIPLFLRRREIDLYTMVHRSMNLDDLDPWASSFMDRRALKIQSDVPYVDIDFSGL